jgi:hypothetical protein
MNQGWHIKNIYLYLVSLVTLMMIVFGLIFFLNNVARMVFPVSYQYRMTIMDLEREYQNTNRELPSVSELERIRDERYQAEQQQAKTISLRNLVSSLFVWLIPIPFYLYHWRKIRTGLLQGNGREIL